VPKIVNKEQRKKEIALAALDIFAEKGFEAATINEITRFAGIGKGTIYEYFKSKDDLIFNSIKVWLELIEKKTKDQIVEINDPAQRLRTFVQASMEAFISDEHAMKLSIALMQITLSETKPYIEKKVFFETLMNMSKIIVDILQDGVSKGVFKPEVSKNAEKIAVNLLAYLDGISAYYCINKAHINLKKQIDIFLKQLMASIMMPQSTQKKRRV